jgi:hypothetical protein
MLATQNKNHHKVNLGRSNKNPFLKIIFRVWLFSYVILAKQNKAEEHKP